MSGETCHEENTLIQETNNYIRLKTSKAKQCLDHLEDVTLNIAVTGESGVGKSTFVNVLRGLRDGDEGAAETGVTETTLKPIRYSHPTMPNVYIWDLPGIGTPNFRAKKYLKDVQFDAFDFFVIISSVRFKENDIMLAREIKKMKKMFYFVRSKIDDDLRTEALKKDFNEDNVLHEIRQSCKVNLKRVGDCEVFLISTFNLAKYDFQRLVDSLEKNLPQHKRYVLIQSMPVFSMAMIEKKKRALFKSACAAAAGTGVTAAVPIPGLSVGCGIGVTVAFLKKAHAAFGLDDESIKRLSERFNVPEAKFRSVIKSRFAEGVSDKVVLEMLKTVAMAVAKTVEVILSSIPGVGGLPAMGLAFATTLHLLHESIREMTEDAKKVLAVALANRTMPSDVL